MNEDVDRDEREQPRPHGVRISPGRGMPGLTIPTVEVGVPDREDSDWVPPPPPPGLVRRIIGRIRKPHRDSDAADG